MAPVPPDSCQTVVGINSLSSHLHPSTPSFPPLHLRLILLALSPNYIWDVSASLSPQPRPGPGPHLLSPGQLPQLPDWCSSQPLRLFNLFPTQPPGSVLKANLLMSPPRSNLFNGFPWHLVGGGGNPALYYVNCGLQGPV